MGRQKLCTRKEPQYKNQYMSDLTGGYFASKKYYWYSFVSEPFPEMGYLVGGAMDIIEWKYRW